MVYYAITCNVRNNVKHRKFVTIGLGDDSPVMFRQGFGP